MPASLRLRFVVPDPELFPSGGNLYNAQLIRALKMKNADALRLDFEQFEAREKADSDIIYFMDTLFLDKIRQSSLDLKNCFLIVHHLESLYPAEGSAAIFDKKERVLLKRFNGFLTSSDFTKQYLLDWGFSDRPIIVIYPALSFKPELIQKSTDSIKALLVANLIERKGVYPFLEAIRRSNIHPEKCQIQIAGSADLEPEYAKRCLDLIATDKKLALMIAYRGACNLEQIRHLYRDSNLFISASFMETYGMALQEAAACCLPILAIDGGNSGYHVEAGKNGFLFHSIQDLVSKLELLSQDNPMLKKLVDGAWESRKIEQYSWEDAAALFLQKLQQHVANRV